MSDETEHKTKNPSLTNFFYGLAGICTCFWMSSALYIQDARQISVVTMFGEPIHVVTEPGLGYKVPWPIQK